MANCIAQNLNSGLIYPYLRRLYVQIYGKISVELDMRLSLVIEVWLNLGKIQREKVKESIKLFFRKKGCFKRQEV